MGGFLTVLIGSLNIIAIFQAMHPASLGELISAIAHAFRNGQEFVFATVRDFGIPQLIKYFNIKISLSNFWRDIVTILILYNSAHVKESFSEKVKHKIRAFVIRLIGAIGSVLVALWVSTNLNSWGVSQLINIVISVGAGVVAYRVVFSFQFSMDQLLDHSKSPWQPFGQKLWGALELTIGTLVLMGLFAFFRELKLGAVVAALDIFFLMAFVLFLCFYHVSHSFKSGINSLQEAAWETEKSELVTSGHFKIGIRIFLVFIFAAQGLILAALELIFVQK